MKLIKNIKDWSKDKLYKNILTPVDDLIDQNLNDISTTIGSFVIRSVRGKFQRSITIPIGGQNSYNKWMEDALYEILYEWNNIKSASRLELSAGSRARDKDVIYYRLDDGTHNLKYRNFNILLHIQSSTVSVTNMRSSTMKIYTIITYDLSPDFVVKFENDMLKHRNSLLKINKDLPTVNLYQDYHESDGYTYWESCGKISKRRLGTIYLPYDQKKQIVDTVNEFVCNKEYYRKHGIVHNLKILLYGEPGPQPVSEIIPTPDGMRIFGDIMPGDMVFGPDGNPTEVEEVYEYTHLDVYTVLLGDGRRIRCAGEHKWPIITNDGNIIEKSVDELHAERLYDESSNPRFYMPLGKAAQYPEKELPVDPWVLGVILGCCNFSNPDQLSINTQHEQIANAVAFILELDVKSFGDDTWYFYNKDGSAVSTKEFFSNIPEIYQLYDGNDHFDQIEYNIFIPDYYIFNSKINRLQLIRGLMDARGKFNEITNPNVNPKNHLIFYSTSKKLCSQVTFIIRSLGYMCKDNEYSTIICWNGDKYLFYQELKEDDKNYEEESVRSIAIIDIIEMFYKENMHCLHVKNDKHMYQTTDFAVTFNTGKDSIAKMIASEWNREIYYIKGGKDGRFIPHALTDVDDNIRYPLYLISDIDKYPYLINEPDINITDGEAKEDAIKQKQLFGEMINALDGVLSNEDAIIVMTTNHIEKFSDTFLRPGRVDLKMYISYVTPEVFRKYVFDFYHVELPKDIKIKDKITVAMMQFDVVFMKLPVDEFVKKYTL
jgi:hypothetical protein